MKTFDREKIKIAAFDLDNTVLLNGEIRPAVKQALFDLRNSGLITVVSTGRCYSMVAPDVACCFEAGSYSNGGYCKTADGVVVSENPMDKETVIKLFQKTRGLGGDAFYFTAENRIVSENCYSIAMTWALNNRRMDYYNLCKSVHDRWKADLVSDTLEALLNETRPIIKVETNFPQTQMKLQAADYSSNVLGLETVIMDKMSLEINAGGISKATGIKAVAEYYGYGLENVAAFGDSSNDLPMLEAAGFAVAMASGDEQAKSRAHYIAPPVEEDGIATALKELFAL